VTKGTDLNRHRGLRALTDEVYNTVMAAAPVEASLLGDRRFDAALPDLSREGLNALAGKLDRLTAEVERLDVAGLSAGDQVTADVATHVVDHARHELRAGYVEFAAGRMAVRSAASPLLSDLPRLTLDTPEQADAYVRRCRGIPAFLGAAEARLRDGVAAGRAPAARLVAATIRQIDRYLATPPDADPLMLEGAGAALAAVLRDEVRPALARHRDVLAGDITPHARPDARVGLHQLGRDLIDQLASEYRKLGARVLSTSDVDEIFAQLRTAPALRFQTANQIRRAAEAALARAVSAVGEWVATVPRISCEMREIPAVEAPESTIAYYQAPPIDGSQPGRYYVNLSDPTTRTRFEAEALAFHESVPGHHTQIARALELDLPALQRVFYVTAFVEGWALYAERLADEMGLYSDDMARLGMLSFDSWRACRLVVDTGIHALGWSRDRAVEFMLANSPQALNNIANEVDRYIGWPGQALAYMAGRARIVALRRRAEAVLCARFDLPTFHDALLEHAAVPLWTLERLVDGWIAQQAG
jgi:uncharacterized protein (DUF885 family)